MADDIDAMLQSEEERTRTDSQPGNNTQEPKTSNPIEGQEAQAPEEVEWKSLKGSAADRFRKLVQEKKDLQEQLKNRPTYQAPIRPENPEVKDAVSKLSAVGIATDEKVDKKIEDRVGQLQYQMYLDRLENQYSGNKGEPKFDRTDYEDYVSRHPEYRGYLPEDVYKFKMYPEEYRDWESKNQSSQPSRSSKFLRPQRTSEGQEPLSPELIEQRLKEPDGKEWYAKNETKINAILSRMASGE